MPTSHPHKPFIIGVAGGTGSGKTTVVENILAALGKENVVRLMHDDYYRDQSEMTIDERRVVNYDHPSAFETELLIEHLHELMEGRPIHKPTYDFTAYTRAKPTEIVLPAPIIVVEGILLLTDPSLRELFNLKVFVEVPADIRLIRRLTRDMKERGRSLDSVINQYMTTVRPMHEQFVEPSRQYADVIIPEVSENPAALQLLLARLKEVLAKTS